MRTQNRDHGKIQALWSHSVTTRNRNWSNISSHLVIYFQFLMTGLHKTLCTTMHNLNYDTCEN